MSLVFSFKILGKRLKRSPTEMMMLAFTPKSICDLNRENKRSICSEQIKEETHMNLHRARIADLSRMHMVGAYYADSADLYFSFACLAMFTMGTRNFPSRPF